MPTLALIRHGQSQWNLENRFTGWVDVDLTAEGEAQAERGGALIKQTGLAFDRGEIPGIGSASLEFIESKRWIERGDAKILFTIGPERSAKYADAPSAVELMENDRDRNVMKLITVSSVIGRALIAPRQLRIHVHRDRHPDALAR